MIINEEADGNFQVKFAPKLPGVYHISAKINGDNLADSPFTIEVQKRKLEADGELHLQNETLQMPADIAVSSKGLTAIADSEKNCILICGDKEGKIVRQVGCKGEKPGQLSAPDGVTSINDDEILVADQLNHRVQQFNVQSAHNFVNSFGQEGTGDGNFKNPASVCVDDEGRIIVSEYINSRVQVLTRMVHQCSNLEIVARKNWTVLWVASVTKTCLLSLIVKTVV